VTTLRGTLAAWPAAGYQEGSFLTQRGRVSPACSGRQQPARWPSIFSSSPFPGLSSFSRSSSCPQTVNTPPLPFHPHAMRRARPGRDSPHKPEAGTANGNPRAGTDKRILSAAPATEKEAAATTLRETEARSRASVPPAPRALGEAGRSGTDFRGRAGAGGGCTGRVGPGERWRVGEVPASFPSSLPSPPGPR